MQLFDSMQKQYNKATKNVKNELNKFKQACDELLHEANILSRNAEIKIAQDAARFLDLLGYITGVMHDVIFMEANQPPMHKDFVNPIGLGLIPTLTASMKYDEQIAKFFEFAARRATLQSEYEVEMNGNDHVVVDVFGLNKAGIACEKFYQDTRLTDKQPTFGKRCYEKLGNVVHSFGKLANALSKLAYFSFVGWRMAAEAKNAFIEFVKDVVSPISLLIGGVSTVAQTMSNTLSKYANTRENQRDNVKTYYYKNTKVVPASFDKITEQGVAFTKQTRFLEGSYSNN